MDVQVPIVCAARGWIVGVGLSLALACDFTVVADDSRLWAPFARRGLTPDGGISWLVPRLVGVARAREMILLGRVVDGRTAADWGLVHCSVEADAVDREARELAGQLASGPTVSLGLAKSLVNRGLAVAFADQLHAEAAAMEVAFNSDDYHEGLSAFAEGRKPVFRGR
jgi:2-(1,2-epoxy-1,2-dihydrophenyl)acetyl-CoA isomerase